MNVEWTKRELQSGRRAKAYRIDALLIKPDPENTDPEEDRGEHLASIEERVLKSRELGVRAFHQGIFWAHADKKLDALNLEPAERDAIDEKIKETKEKLFIENFISANDALEHALAVQGAKTRILAMPFGASTLPHFKD